MHKKKTVILFFSKGLAFGLALVVFTFSVVMPRFTTTYNAAILDKFNRLTSITQPQIILVGGSNVAIGVDSKKMEEALGIPVVNFGLHGGLGQPFHTEMIRDEIGPGDIVVLAPEEFDADTTKIPDCTLAWMTVENHTALWGGIALENLPGMVAALPNYLRRALDMWQINSGTGDYGDIIYNRRMFDEHGDNVYPRPKPLIEESYDGSSFTTAVLSDTMADYWNDYAALAAEKGATLYMSSPPILEHQKPDNLAAFQQELADRLDFAVISSFEDYVYPYSYFYDTGFHLNDAGVKLRTAQLIDDLQRQLA